MPVSPYPKNEFVTRSVGADVAGQNSELTRTVRLEQIFPLLLDAVANDSAWLADFSEEPVTISDDLYDVILAYRHFRKN